MIPYGRQQIDDDDIQAVLEVLRSDWLTTGPKVREFEEAFARYVGTEHAIAVSNGTAALHAIMYALDIKPGDEVIIPTMTFVATANSVVYQGGTPVFVDVKPSNLLIDPQQIETLITDRTKAIVAVDYAGHPCDYDALEQIAVRHDLLLVDDACHAVGGCYGNRRVGSLADLNAFSLHPVKHITTGEGGVVTTDREDLAERMRLFRNHGIDSDHYQREKEGSWAYQMIDLGYNYRLTDFQCALGLSQLKKLDRWVVRRREIAARYDASFANMPLISPLKVEKGINHAYHLYVVRVPGSERERIFRSLRAEGIGVNVHYMPVHLHPFYRQRFGTGPGLCLEAERAYEEIITLPVFPAMTDEMADTVIKAVKRVIHGK
jgi:perosamine synthetase